MLIPGDHNAAVKEMSVTKFRGELAVLALFDESVTKPNDLENKEKTALTKAQR